MEPRLRQLVEAIHARPERLVLAVAGGGSLALAHLLEVPGASRTVLEALVPYADEAMLAFLGGKPDQACSSPTARAMAMAAFCRARRYETGGRPLLGVACTASLASDRPKRGPHRAHLAVQSEALTATWSLELDKGRRTRAEEEELVSRLLLRALGDICEVPEPLGLELSPRETLQQERRVAPPAWRELLLGQVEAVRHGGAASEATGPKLLFPGAFNPLHLGHRRMAAVAEELVGRPVEFEISVFNVEKPPLDYLEIGQRSGQFTAEQTLWLTRLPTFEAKSRHFPGATFVVGTDTLARIANPRFYGDDPAACQQALERIAARDCHFLVFGRQMGGGYLPLSRMDLPEPLRSLCQEVPETRFREDISSTELRRGSSPWMSGE